MKKRLYDEYIRRLLEVNDESKTDDEHRQIETRFRGWLEGVEDAAGHRFNGDYYYIKLFDSGKMQERPLCCGVFLDWKSNDEMGDRHPQPDAENRKNSQNENKD